MATSSIHFDPTTQNFGELKIRETQWKSAGLSSGHGLSVNLLIGLAFVLAFIVALSGLYLMDQTVFSTHSDATATTQNAASVGAFVDYN